MRLYCAGNMYLSSIQQGIQALHVLGELNNKYAVDSSGAAKILFDWQKNHKTVVLLNGGPAQALRELYDLLKSEPHGYPFAKFHEDEFSLDGALTSVGIVLPESIYGMDLGILDVEGKFTYIECEIAAKIQSMSLAR